MILGIDTSNYTTSVSVAGGGRILMDKRRMLKVKENARGLRQSEAFFQHIKALPELLESLGELKDISGISVSVSPRRVEGSYMPCFVAGHMTARSLAACMGLPLYEFSHQEGHIRAALMGSKIEETEPFICVHLSGGTTEILVCEKDSLGYRTKIAGKTMDISAGQLIDRIGTLCSLPFPSGKAMDSLYDPGAEDIFKPSVKGAQVSFSGIETRAANLYKQGKIDKISLFSGIFNVISDSLSLAVKYTAQNEGIKRILFAGGVSSSANIAGRIKRKLSCKTPAENSGIYCEFSQAVYASDNAAGLALLGEERRVNG